MHNPRQQVHSVTTYSILRMAEVGIPGTVDRRYGVRLYNIWVAAVGLQGTGWCCFYMFAFC